MKMQIIIIALLLFPVITIASGQPSMGHLNWQGSVVIATDLRAVALEAQPYFHRHVSPMLASAFAEAFGISIAFFC
jgi:hypothetical protein